MPYGYKFQIGVQRVTEPDPNPRGHWGLAALVALAVIAVALLVWPARNAPAAPAPAAAHIAAAPTPTATPKPGPPPVVVHVTGHTGAVCFLPGGKTINPVTLAVVP
jgi:multidrug efflux pump subunit AcrA (membrane-fusion protein)